MPCISATLHLVTLLLARVYSFIGFDCVSTLAEEVKNPAVDMPVGIVGSISVVTGAIVNHPCFPAAYALLSIVYE